MLADPMEAKLQEKEMNNKNKELDLQAKELKLREKELNAALSARYHDYGNTPLSKIYMPLRRRQLLKNLPQEDFQKEMISCFLYCQSRVLNLVLVTSFPSQYSLGLQC